MALTHVRPPIIGWCKLCLASLLFFLLPACVDLNLDAPQAGFHPASPLPPQAKNLNQNQRDALYQDQHASVNDVGFQVGLAPMDAGLLARQFEDNGRPDLAEALRQVDRDLAGMDNTMHFEAVIPYFGPFLALHERASIAARRGDYVGIVADYDLWLQNHLAAQGELSSVKTLPQPPEDSPMLGGANEGPDDRIWDRSIHRADPGEYPYKAFLVGGLGVDAEVLEDYLRDEASPAIADAFTQGHNMQIVGGVMAGAGGAVAGLGLVVWFFDSFAPQGNPTNEAVGTIAVSGLVVAAAGLFLDAIGPTKMGTALREFNDQLADKIHLRLGLPLTPPVSPNPW